ncbi:DUF2523 family protein [Marinobacterium stanieri]|uniref:DUF2523 domain-containing protein n=1 Tax=Marinobacterium stanieri TaxID=49186 RepID=A0A1N6R797_9GAMM|nr:DUF2523 family protein [Marinobacterium stanieri]SIQ24751.1 Protein of unknown function [Marinobacterium stanieri]
MFKSLFKLLEWFSTGGITSMMTHAGLSMIVFAGLDAMVSELLDTAVDGLNGLPSAALQLALLAGISEFFSIIGGAILTRIALMTAMNSVGLTYKGGDK